MKLSILKENFLRGLNIANKATSKSITLPILNNILLSTEKNFLRIASTDLEMGIQYWVLAKTEKEGCITIPARFLINLITLIPDEKIKLETKGETLYVEGKEYKNQIKGLKPDDFPIIPEVKDDKKIEIDNQLLTKGLSMVVGSASLSQTRPEISGVYFSLDGNSLEVVATDSFRLAQKKISLSATQLKEKISLIVLQKTIQEVINIFGEVPGKTIIYFSPNQIMFEARMSETSHPRVRVTSRLVEGEYPNYKEIIPRDFKTRLLLQKQDFLTKIKTASLFSGKINEITLKIKPDQKLVEVFAQNPDLGESRSKIEGGIDGDNAEISFNYRFLVDGLANIDTKEVIFKLNGEESPGVLKPTKDESFVYVVMPIKNT